MRPRAIRHTETKLSLLRASSSLPFSSSKPSGAPTGHRIKDKFPSPALKKCPACPTFFPSLMVSELLPIIHWAPLGFPCSADSVLLGCAQPAQTNCDEHTARAAQKGQGTDSSRGEDMAKATSRKQAGALPWPWQSQPWAARKGIMEKGPEWSHTGSRAAPKQLSWFVLFFLSLRSCFVFEI